MKSREATEADYQKLQGGKPIVEDESGIHKIVHDYPGGENMVVPTHNMDMGTVLYPIGDEVVEFEVSLVRDLHGGPCEAQSRSVGGDPYERRP